MLNLTVDELIGAHADLLNAARVVQYAGHYTGAIVNATTGEVCMAGAIDLATFRVLHYEAVTPGGPGVFATPATATLMEKAFNRAEAAYSVLAAFIPDALCKGCDSDAALPYAMEPWEKVTHYNDEHCTGGRLAENMLRLAAVNALVQAEARKKFNENLVVLNG